MGKKRISVILIRALVVALVIVFFGWVFSKGYLNKIFDEFDVFLMLMRQHLEIVGLSSLLAILIAIPLGILVTRPKFKKLEWPAVFIANLGQTIPSLAMLALAMSFLGVGFKPAVFALFLYSILPILNNTIAGLNSVNNNIKDAARGMGFKPYQILFRIELPNASYSILAGIRTAIVVNIGTAALAFLIGGGGLGNWIFTGILLFDNNSLLSGAIPLTLLAIAVDYLLKGVEKIVVPKAFINQMKLQKGA